MRHPSYQQIYEWEDIFCDMLKASLTIDTDIAPLATHFGNFYNMLPLVTHKTAFVFDMNPFYRMSNHNNRTNIIPCIIDFYSFNEEDLKQFYQKYSDNKLIFISSLEVYNWLKSKGCPLNIQPLALSISDKYRISSNTLFEKKYDVLLMGRQNPVLQTWLDEYEKTHGNLVVALCKKENGHYNYYTRQGDFVGNADKREGVIDLLRKSRIGLYSTKGMDSDCKQYDLHGFTHVTPRFFEFIASGCHIISRYIQNAETNWFQLEQISENTESYIEFEQQMNYALTHSVDMVKYSSYLENHYTSKRVIQVQETLKNL